MPYNYIEFFQKFLLPQVIIHKRTKLTNYSKMTNGAADASDTDENTAK